ncbi:MAG: DUF4190 domain-containing protein [Phycisphaerales bacterium]
MSQNPYAQTQQPMGFDPQQPPAGPAKTSVMAIVALVLSLLVCVPGLGVIGLILGVIALLMISGSRGLKKGKGIAIAAIIFGLITSTIWIGGITVAVRGSLRQKNLLHDPIYDAFRKLDNGDTSAVRALLAPSLEANITDAEILAFRDGYHALGGECKGEPRTTSDALAPMSVATNFNLMQRVQTTTGKQPIVLPASFDKGGGAILVVGESFSQWSFVLDSPKVQGGIVNLAVSIPGAGDVVLTEFVGTTGNP